jgi:hypothetical protein
MRGRCAHRNCGLRKQDGASHRPGPRPRPAAADRGGRVTCWAGPPQAPRRHNRRPGPAVAGQLPARAWLAWRDDAAGKPSRLGAPRRWPGRHRPAEAMQYCSIYCNTAFSGDRLTAVRAGIQTASTQGGDRTEAMRARRSPRRAQAAWGRRAGPMLGEQPVGAAERTDARAHGIPDGHSQPGPWMPDGSGGNGQGRRLGQAHPRHPGPASHQARPGPEPAHNTQNAGRSARLTRERPAAERP